jgi:hypothetical protein
MRVERNVDNSVTITREVSLVVGRRFRISPSQGYLGITQGYVDILAILPANVDEGYVGFGDIEDPEEALSRIQDYKDVELTSCTDRDGVPYPEYSQVLGYLDNTDWVVYHYPHNNHGESGIYVFPIWEFSEHISLF